MRIHWLAVLLLAVTVFTLTGCATSRNGRYGRYDRYGGRVYGPAQRSVYIYRDRDYRWERERRAREEWRRHQRKHEQRERRRDRDSRYDRRRD
jgi:hypothetical protein